MHWNMANPIEQSYSKGFNHSGHAPSQAPNSVHGQMMVPQYQYDANEYAPSAYPLDGSGHFYPLPAYASPMNGQYVAAAAPPDLGQGYQMYQHPFYQQLPTSPHMMNNYYVSPYGGWQGFYPRPYPHLQDNMMPHAQRSPPRRHPQSIIQDDEPRSLINDQAPQKLNGNAQDDHWPSGTSDAMPGSGKVRFTRTGKEAIAGPSNQPHGPKPQRFIRCDEGKITNSIPKLDREYVPLTSRFHRERGLPAAHLHFNGQAYPPVDVTERAVRGRVATNAGESSGQQEHSAVEQGGAEMMPQGEQADTGELAAALAATSMTADDETE